MHRIDLNLLAHLLAMLHTRSVTRAAARLGVSQPAMSRSLAELRRLFVDPLLVRTRGGMLLTRRAEELVQPLQDWLAQVGTIILPQAVEPSALDRRLRIIASDFAFDATILPAWPRLTEAAPRLAIDILPAIGDPRERLACGEADLAVTTRQKDRHLIHDRLLMREPYVCLVRHGHPLQREAAARELDPGDYRSWPQIRIGAGTDGDILETAGGGRIIASLPGLDAGAALLASSDAVILAPASSARRHCDGTLAELPPAPGLDMHEHWAVWHNRTHSDPTVHWLIEMLAADGGLPAAANDPGAWPADTLTAAE